MDETLMEARSEEIFSCEAKALRATNKALLCELESGDTVWIPQSVIHDDSEVYEAGNEGHLMIQMWWAKKNGIA